ncbi:MAG: FAD-dependent oxidoreductase [Patescibacteria group bacterium]
MLYDLVIIGGGPAGIAAGVYASRKQLKTLFLTKDWGGQSTVSPGIQNWIGTPSISGTDLAKELKEHLDAYAGDVVHIHENAEVTQIEQQPDHFLVYRSEGEAVTARAILVTTGSERRRLQIPGAEQFEHKGLTYCASCDGPLFAGQDVAVIGGGNAGFETAAQLLAYTKSVTLLQRSDTYKADPATVETVLAHENMTGILNAEITEIQGENFVHNITYKDAVGGLQSLAVTGVFAEIGLIPNTGFLGELLELDDYGRIIIDPWTQQTSVPGIWAAGDCTNIKYHQNNISAGDGVRALEDIYVNLKAK